MSTTPKTFSTNKGTGLTIYVSLRRFILPFGSVRIVVTFLVTHIVTRFLFIGSTTEFSFPC